MSLDNSPRVAVYRSPILPLSETFIRDQVRAMHRWNATLFGETLYDPRPVLDGITHQALWRDTRIGRTLRRADRLLEQVMGYSPAKHRALRTLRPDLVHVHFATDAVQAWPTLRRLGVPVVVTLHGYDINTHADWWHAGHGGPRMRDYPERLREMAADPSVHFIAVSQAIRRAALAQGVGDERMSIRHIGIPTQNFPVEGPPPSQRRPDVLFVGRLVEKKGGRFLVEAAAALRERVPGVRLVFIGDGPCRDDLAAQARRLDVDARFLGAQPQAEVRRQLVSARALCLPSVTAANGDAEGLGMVLLEAQCAGVPVVTSAKGGSEEAIVDGVTGFAFGEGDVPRLAQSLEVLLRDGARVDLMAREAAQFVRRQFDIGHCTRALETHYDHILADAVLEQTVPSWNAR
ncbi:glycosyltransferase [Piscinibacter terrae]|uniref:Glycosyltransferase n=1 Tax=Piscinibacter terrae TaxID=2496871 RepID=A0A3N7HVZ7_9BURK|nr:glycosyltransferase [Albitalea terrae]RQP26560.1 glycosyltransferase [Albitalea terrae]